MPRKSKSRCTEEEWSVRLAENRQKQTQRATLERAGACKVPPTRQPVPVKCVSCGKEYTLPFKRVREYLTAGKEVRCLACAGVAARRPKIKKTEEQKTANRSAASARNWQSPSYRSHIIGTLSTRSPEAKDRMVESLRTTLAGKKEELSARSKARWADPEYAKSVSDTIHAMWKDPKYAQSISESMTKRWRDDPDFRPRVMAAIATPECMEKRAVKRASQPRISSLQSTLYSLLDTLGVAYEPEGTPTAIGHYAFDCLVPKTGEMKKHLLIECQGDYWHSLPKAVSNDKAKFTYIERYFPDYEIMYIWEHEFYTDGRVLDRLRLKLGVGVETKDYNFSDIATQEGVPYKELQSFLDAYHYIGKGRGGRVFGAYHGEVLVAACVFSPPLRGNHTSLHGEFVELSRLCIHPSYHKKNFASWFVSRCLRSVKEKVVAYADTTVGHQGTVYKAANFRLLHEVPPDYWYADESGFIMHKMTLYKKARQMRMAETDYAAANGYRKQWGGKKLCYVFPG